VLVIEGGGHSDSHTIDTVGHAGDRLKRRPSPGLQDDFARGTFVHGDFCAGDIRGAVESGGVWTSVGTATVNPDGSFAAPAVPQPGTYRAVVAAAGGLAAGVSPTLRVE